MGFLVLLLGTSIIMTFYLYSSNRKMKRRVDDAKRYYKERVEEVRKEYDQNLKDEQGRLFLDAVEKVKGRYLKQWQQEWERSNKNMELQTATVIDTASQILKLSASVEKPDACSAVELPPVEISEAEMEQLEAEHAAGKICLFDSGLNNFRSIILKDLQVKPTEFGQAQWKKMDRYIERSYSESKPPEVIAGLLRKQLNGKNQQPRDMLF